MNYIFSEEYTLKMIEGRGSYSYFCEYPLCYPAFYNEKTISLLNQSYNNSFDVLNIYDVTTDFGIETYSAPDDYNDFDIAVNKALTDVYNDVKTIDESYEDILAINVHHKKLHKKRTTAEK